MLMHTVMRSMAQIAALSLMLVAQGLPAATQSFAIIGDAGKWNENSESVRNSIRRSGVKDLVMPGDNLYWGTYESVWSHWQDFDFSVVAIGNHTAGYGKEIKYFKMPGEYYSKTMAGDIRFLVLNSDNSKSASAQMSWLDKELQKDAAMTFLVWHHPTYTVSSAHNWWEKYSFQQAARELLHRYSDKITALIVGHDHVGAFYCVDEIPMLISGAVHETRYPETKNYTAEDQSEVIAQWVYPANTPTWARLDVDSEKQQAEVTFIRAADDKVLFSSRLSENPKASVCRTGLNVN